MTYDVEHLFICYLPSIYLLCWDFSPDPFLFCNWVIFLLLNFKSFLYIWGNSPLSVIFCKCILLSAVVFGVTVLYQLSSASVFSCLQLSFQSRNSVFNRVGAFILKKSNLSKFFHGLCFLLLHIRSHLQAQGHLDFLLCHLLEVI